MYVYSNSKWISAPMSRSSFKAGLFLFSGFGQGISEIQRIKILESTTLLFGKILVISVNSSFVLGG